MKTIPPALPKSPKLPKPQKTEEFSPVNFNVLHGRVIECFEAKIPVVRGCGLSVRGYGSSWVGTTVHNVLSCWFVDHQTGQQHKIDFGQDYLDMRYGHDATMLWANDQLYAIANHTTGQIKYPALNRPILPQKKVGSILFHIVALPVLLGLTALFLWIGLAYTKAAAHGQSRMQMWEYGGTAVDAAFANPKLHPIMHDPAYAAIFLIGTLVVGLTPSILMSVNNHRNRRFNVAQTAYLTYKLRQAEDQWIRHYAPPRITAR
jgi:hypothetical protein